jgi:hypothetical protein
MARLATDYATAFQPQGPRDPHFADTPVTLDGGIPLLVHLANRPRAEGAQHPQGSVDVLPLPGAIISPVSMNAEQPHDLA